MAGKKSAKGSDKDKQLTLNIGVDAGDAVKTLEKVKTTTESAAKAADKTNKSLEKTNKELEKQNKHLEKQNKLLQEKNNKLTDEERKRKNQLNEEQKLAQIKLTTAKIEETNQRQRLALENAAYKKQRDQLKDLEKQKKDAAKAEEKQIKEAAKLQLDGVKKLKAELADLKQQQKDLQKHGYGAIVNAFTEGFPARLGTAAVYKTIGVGLETIRDSLNSLVGLEQQFAAIYAITDSTAASMERLRETIFNVGTASLYSAEQLAQATITLGQAGLSAEQIVDALEAVNNLAVGTGTDLAMSVNVLTSSLAVWNKEASQAGHVADVLTTAANRTRADVGTMANAIQYAGAAASDLGVSFEEFAAVASAVTNAGLKARSVVGTGFRSVLTELINPSAKLQKVFKQLGVNIEDVDVRSRGLVNVLQTLKDAGLDAAMAFQGFDRRAASFFVAATSQLDTVDKLRDAFLQEGSAMRAAEKQMDTFAAQFERLKNAMKKTFSEAFRPFLYVLTELIKAFAWFSSTKFGEFVNSWLALATTILALKSAVVGLVKAYGDLRKISMLVIAKAAELTAAQTELTGANIAEATSAELAGTKMKGLAAAVLLVKKAVVGLIAFMKAHPLLLIVTAIAAALTIFHSNIKSTEEALDEANNKLKESDDRIKSLESAYDELVQKQKSYREDQSSLIIRGRELNKQFDLQGELVLKASDSWDEYAKKLRKAIDVEREKEIQFLRMKSRALQGEATSITSDKIGLRSAYGQLYGAAKRGDSKFIAQEREGLESLKGSDKYYKERVKLFDTLLELSEVQVELERLKKESSVSEETINKIVELDKGLQDTSERIADAIGGAVNVKTFEEMTEGLVALKNEIEKERIEKKEQFKTDIQKAKKEGFTDTAIDLQKRANEYELLYTEKLSDVDTQIKNALGKRFQLRRKAYQDFSKSVEKGQTGMSPEAAENELKRLEEELVKVIDAQKAYETSAVEHAENLRKEGLEKKIQKEKGIIDQLTKEFASTEDLVSRMNISQKITEAEDKVAELVRQQVEGVAKYEADMADILDKYDTILAEATSRANAASAKNAAKIGPTLGTLLPYTAALYGGSEKEGFKQLAREYPKQTLYGDSDLAKFFGSGAAARGSILYGQELWGDEKNRRFMDDAWAETALKGIQTFTDGFSNAVIEFANSAKTFKEALRDFASSSLQTIGNWLIQMSIKAAAALALKAMFPEFFSAPYVDKNAGATTATVNIPTKPTVTSAAGGPVTGGIPNRDSVTARLMPGEFVLKKSTVDYLGENFLNALNANAAQTMGAVSGDVIAGNTAPSSVVNVWVVADEDEAGMGPNDVIATITKDIRNGGQTRQLIKSIVAGRK